MTDPVLIELPQRIESERIVLLAPRPGLGAEMALAVTQSLAHLRPWMPWAQEAPTAESAETVIRKMQADFIARTDLSYQIFARKPDGQAGRLLGGTGLHRMDWEVRSFEIGYWIRPEAQGQGLVSEAARMMEALAFETLQARRVVIRCDARNHKSRAVAGRCGFELEGVLRQDALGVDGVPRDTALYAKVRVVGDPPRP